MAMVHQKLYQARNLSSLDLGEYMHELTVLLEHSYKVNLGVFVSLDLESFPVQIDLAIPCGLVLNELVSNALKYAFPNGRSGEVIIRLNKDASDTIHFSVSDNGIGLPEGFDPRVNGRLGLQTLITLVENQLQGKIEFTNGPGLTVSMEFPASQDSESL
jgi:two-component sensor histidine kinase